MKNIQVGALAVCFQTCNTHIQGLFVEQLGQGCKAKFKELY